MKADKKTLMAIKNFLQEKIDYDVEEVISDVVSETKMLERFSLDECSINWDDSELCVLEDFLNSYTELFIKKICNVVDSFVGDDIDLYLEED